MINFIKNADPSKRVEVHYDNDRICEMAAAMIAQLYKRNDGLGKSNNVRHQDGYYMLGDLVKSDSDCFICVGLVSASDLKPNVAKPDHKKEYYICSNKDSVMDVVAKAMHHNCQQDPVSCMVTYDIDVGVGVTAIEVKYLEGPEPNGASYSTKCFCYSKNINESVISLVNRLFNINNNVIAYLDKFLLGDKTDEGQFLTGVGLALDYLNVDKVIKAPKPASIEGLVKYQTIGKLIAYNIENRTGLNRNVDLRDFFSKFNIKLDYANYLIKALGDTHTRYTISSFISKPDSEFEKECLCLIVKRPNEYGDLDDTIEYIWSNEPMDRTQKCNGVILPNMF